MAKKVPTKKKEPNEPAKPIDIYEHNKSKRLNNPQVGLVNTKTEKAETRKAYEHDPHLDPSLRWAGKAEKHSFEVPTVSLHVHERIDPRTIIEAVQKSPQQIWEQYNLFNRPVNKLNFVKEIEFYKHEREWSNRFISGDSLLVMNSLLEKEGLGGKVQTVYFDPPYGIKYESNFQPFVNKRDVKDGRDDDLNSEPETIRAFRDTWELGIHSYLSHIRDRLLLARDLMADSGSCFIQIGEENVHLVRQVGSEVFGSENFVTMIYFKTTGGFGTSTLSRIGDYLLWFAKDKSKVKYRELFVEKTAIETGDEAYKYLELQNGDRRDMTADERNGIVPIPSGSDIYRLGDMCGQGAPKAPTPFRYLGKEFNPTKNSHWKPGYPQGLERLAMAGRIVPGTNNLNYVRFVSDKPVSPINNAWMDTGHAGFASNKKYVVETNIKVIERCILMSSDPGDLILDITCGSGTTPVAAEKWGRRWIAADTSRISIALSKQRLMTAYFDYYELKNPSEGISSGLIYRTVPHVKMSDISGSDAVDRIIEKYKSSLTTALGDLKKYLGSDLAILDVPEEIDDSWEQDKKAAWKKFNSIRKTMRLEIREQVRRSAGQIELVDSPTIDDKKIRITGPFTVEAVPAPVVRTLKEDAEHAERLNSQPDLISELLKTGIRLKNKEYIRLSRLESQSATKWIHAEGVTNEERPQRVVVSFGPDFAPLEQKQVELAIQEAEKLKPSPTIIVFAAFQFDPEAAKDIDELDWGGVSILKVQMNSDLFTDDLKKKKTGNDSFWLIGQPDVQIVADRNETYKVVVNGFDYYNPKIGAVEAGGADKIAMWMLDTDYDGRSLMPRQVFFPMAGPKDGWAKLAKTLKNEIDAELIEAYRGTESLPFEAGDNKRIAVKIIDDRGIESLLIRELNQ